MKKITLCAIALMASATSFAQTVLWDGEDETLNGKNYSYGFWGDGSPSLVANTEKDGINASANCVKFTMTNENKVVKLPFRDWIKPSMNGSKRISLMIRKNDEDNVMVALSDPTDGSNGYYLQQAAYYTGAGKWQKLVFDYTANGAFDNPGIMTITAQTGNVDGEQDVYIDNIVIEDAPRINDKLFSEYSGKITGDVKLTGAWMSGSSSKVDNITGVWESNGYNDFAYFSEQSDDKLTSVDMRGTVTKFVNKKEEIEKFFANNSNTILYADEAYDHVNVVAEQKFTNANNEEVTDLYAKNGLVLTDAKAFSCPKTFTAANVKLTRKVHNGINSFVLPFYVGAGDLGAEALATFKEADASKVSFTKVDHVDANIPFITVGLNGAVENKNNEFTFFGNQKLVEPIPDDFNKDNFKGVYTPQSAKDLYGIDENGNLHKGGESAKINAFHAYYQGTPASAKISFEGEATGINAVTTTSTSANGAVYDLSGRRVAASLAAAKLAKGIYVVNGKKVAVK